MLYLCCQYRVICTPWIKSGIQYIMFLTAGDFLNKISGLRIWYTNNMCLYIILLIPMVRGLDPLPSLYYNVFFLLISMIRRLWRGEV